jgi:hypothetical protein
MNKLLPVIVAAIVIVAGLAMFYLGRASAPEPPIDTQASGPAQIPAGTSNSSETAPAAADEARHIPPQFQGTWALDRLACRATGETSRVEIGASDMAFYESRGRLISATPLNSGREYQLVLGFSGEGEYWERSLNLRRVGHEMSMREADQPERLYIRC